MTLNSLENNLLVNTKNQFLIKIAIKSYYRIQVLRKTIKTKIYLSKIRFQTYNLSLKKMRLKIQYRIKILTSKFKEKIWIILKFLNNHNNHYNSMIRSKMKNNTNL